MKITQYYRNKKTQNSDSIISILLRLMINYDNPYVLRILLRRIGAGMYQIISRS